MTKPIADGDGAGPQALPPEPRVDRRSAVRATVALLLVWLVVTLFARQVAALVIPVAQWVEGKLGADVVHVDTDPE